MLIVPVTPERLVLDVFVDMLALIKQLRASNPTLRVALVPNLVRGQWPAHTAFVEVIHNLAQEHGLPALKAVPARQAIMLGNWERRPLRHVADWLLDGE